MQGQPLLLAALGLALLTGSAAIIRALVVGRRVQAWRIAVALWANAGGVMERFVIGDEDSWLHAPTRIRLEPVRTASAGGAR